MEQNIDNFIRENKKSVEVFMPQLEHAPESLSHAIKRATLEWSAANLHPLTSVERKDLIGKILGAVAARGRDKDA